MVTIDKVTVCPCPCVFEGLFVCICTCIYLQLTHSEVMGAGKSVFHPNDTTTVSGENKCCALWESQLLQSSPNVTCFLFQTPPALLCLTLRSQHCWETKHRSCRRVLTPQLSLLAFVFHVHSLQAPRRDRDADVWVALSPSPGWDLSLCLWDPCPLTVNAGQQLRWGF